MHDLVIRNAQIADGLGNPLATGDLAVDGDRVAAVGPVSAEGRKTVDAQGMVLAPGVIDVHTHYDAQLTWDPTASPSPALGVTTVVIGNCGFGIAPIRAESREKMLADLAEVEGMPLESLQTGVNWSFESFPEYLDALRRQGTYPNVAALATHSTIRAFVMGEDSTKRTATAEESAEMIRLFHEAMKAGAAGLGSSSNENRRAAGGTPIGSRLADAEEYRAFAEAMAEYDHGVFMITTGNHMDMAFIKDFARRSGRPSIYAAHFYYAHEPDRGRNLMHAAAAARAQGIPAYTQGSCQPLSLSFPLDAAYILKAIPPWPGTSDHDELRQIFRDPEFRDAFRTKLATPEQGRTFNGRWEWVLVTTVGKPENAALEGKTVAEIADARGVDPLDLFFDLSLEEGFKTIFTIYILNMVEEGVEELITNDGTLISLSDAGAHNSLLCDAAYAMHLFSHWVREKGVFDLPTAIRKVTSDPADVYGFVDRGRLTEGAYADMILFDPDKLRVTGMERHFDLPAGGERLLRRAPGLLGTWVNGVRVFDGENYLTPERPPGQVLTRFSGRQPRLAMSGSGGGSRG